MPWIALAFWQEIQAFMASPDNGQIVLEKIDMQIVQVSITRRLKLSKAERTGHFPAD